VGIKGWALESRVYAEDPMRNFMPSIGRLSKYQEPPAVEGRPDAVRCDAGVGEGTDITIHYDPMICKLITHGKDRAEAVELMRKALDSYVISGVKHNVNFLRSLLEHPRFLKGDFTTAFIPQEYPQGYTVR
jgi:propionyl-CoA carboxylase alpha chain